MSIFKDLKRALGLSSDPMDEEEYDATLTQADVLHTPPTIEEVYPAQVPAPVPVAAPEEEDAEVVGLRRRIEEMTLSFDRQKRGMSDRILDLQNRVMLLEEENEKLRRRPTPKPVDDTEKRRLEQEVERLTALNAQLDTKSRAADRMLTDLRKQAAAERERRADIEERVVALNATLDEQRTRLDEQQNDRDKVLRNLRDKLERVKSERDSMRRTIEQNLYYQAQCENSFRKDIKMLERLLEKNGIPVPERDDPVERPVRTAESSRRRPTDDNQPSLF